MVRYRESSPTITGNVMVEDGQWYIYIDINIGNNGNLNGIHNWWHHPKLG